MLTFTFCPCVGIAALRFQPTVKRPQLAAQKSKPKPSFPKAVVADSTNASNSASRPAQQPVKTTLADWTATGDDDDVNGFYVGEKRQRGGRKRRKKNREEYAVAQDWDDIYDPSRPNNYEDYIHSDEKVREVREWKDRLYAHRIARKQSSDLDSDEEESYRPRMGSAYHHAWRSCPPLLTECRSIRASYKLFICAASDRLTFIGSPSSSGRVTR